MSRMDLHSDFPFDEKRQKMGCYFRNLKQRIVQGKLRVVVRLAIRFRSGIMHQTSDNSGTLLVSAN
jgi:hypothetical protein